MCNRALGLRGRNYPPPLDAGIASSLVLDVRVLQGRLADLADDPRVTGIGLRLPCSNNFNAEAPLVTVVVQKVIAEPTFWKAVMTRVPFTLREPLLSMSAKSSNRWSESNSFPVRFE